MKAQGNDIKNYIQVRGYFLWTEWPRKDSSEKIPHLKQVKEQSEEQASGGLCRGPKAGKSFRGRESPGEVSYAWHTVGGGGKL